MKKTFETIALWKRIDIVFQCLVFLVMLFTVCRTEFSIFGLYIMASGQILSCIIWTFALSGGMFRLHAGNIIRVIFIITALILAIILGLNKEVFMMASIMMLLIGPVLGISYFVITIKEYHFYSKARKPYYLL